MKTTSPNQNALAAGSRLSVVNSFTDDNLVLSTATPISAGSYRVVRYGYAPSGQKISSTTGRCAATDATLDACLPGAPGWEDGGTIGYTYAPNGLLISQVGRNDATITTAYEAAGQPVKIASTSGSVRNFV